MSLRRSRPVLHGKARASCFLLRQIQRQQRRNVQACHCARMSRGLHVPHRPAAPADADAASWTWRQPVNVAQPQDRMEFWYHAACVRLCACDQCRVASLFPWNACVVLVICRTERCNGCFDIDQLPSDASEHWSQHLFTRLHRLIYGVQTPCKPDSSNPSSQHRAPKRFQLLVCKACLSTSTDTDKHPAGLAAARLRNNRQLYTCQRQRSQTEGSSFIHERRHHIQPGAIVSRYLPLASVLTT